MTKVISLSDAAYAEMKSLKGIDESFSDVVIKLAGKARQRPLCDFFGKWPGTIAEAMKIKKMIESDRQRFRTRDMRL